MTRYLTQLSDLGLRRRMLWIAGLFQSVVLIMLCAFAPFVSATPDWENPGIISLNKGRPHAVW